MLDKGFFMKTIISLFVLFTVTVSGFAQAEDPNKVTYEGRIRNTEGHPVAGAWIDIYDIPDRSSVPFHTQHAGRSISNDNGRFSFSRYIEIFDQLECSVAIIQAEGYATQRIHYHVMDEPIDIIMSPHKERLQGWVVDSQGKPIEDALVCTILGSDLYEVGIPALSSHTDRQGHFIISDLPVDVRAEFYVIKEGYEEYFSFSIDEYPEEGQYAAGRQDIKITLKEGTPRQRRMLSSMLEEVSSFEEQSRFPMQRQTVSSDPKPEKSILDAKDLEGTCTDTKGEPVVHARIYLLTDPNNVVYTDSEGRFTLKPRLEECKKNIWWRYLKNKERYETNPSWGAIRLAERYGPSYQNPETDWLGIEAYLVAISEDGSMAALKQFPMYRNLQQVQRSLTLMLKPAYRITGQAILGADLPAAGVEVNVVLGGDSFDPESNYLSGITNEQGYFSFSGLVEKKNYIVTLVSPNGGYHVKHFSSGSTAHGNTLVEHFYSKDSGTFDMGLFPMNTETFEISGIVTDLFGHPVSDAKLTLNAPSQGIEYTEIFTKEDGRFVYDGLLSGPVDLTCHAGEDGYARFGTKAGTKDIRFIIDKKIPERNLGETLVPSAAVELAFIDGDTGKPVILPSANVKIQHGYGNSFNVSLNDKGIARCLIPPGKIQVKLDGTGQTYKPYEKDFVADLYEAYRFECKVNQTESQQILNSANAVVYPETYSKETETWNLRPREESDRNGILRVKVIDRQTEEPLLNAAVLVLFDKGQGRYLGYTDPVGNVVFAICENGFDPRIASITVPGYLTSQPQEEVHADSRYPQEFTVKMERKPQGQIAFPEVFMESDNTWKPQTEMASSGAYHLFEVTVIDDQSGREVPEATVQLLFDDSKGRYIGTTNEQGTAFFAVGPDFKKCVLDTVSAPHYDSRKFNRNFSIQYTDERKETVEITQQVVSVNVSVLDAEGNPASDIMVYNEYFKLNDLYLPAPRWDRVNNGQRNPTNENGQVKLPWLYEPGPQPQIDHFIYTQNLNKTQCAAQLVRALPDTSITIQMVHSVQVEGRIVDAEGHGIPNQVFYFNFLVNGKPTVTAAGLSAQSKADGSYGPVQLIGGFEYEIQINRDRMGTLNGESSFFVDGTKTSIRLPDCVFLK